MTFDAKQNPLFLRHGLTTRKHISVGMVPIPYHIYAGSAILIGGTGDLAYVQQLLATEHVYPIVTTGGRALICIWVVDGKEASLDPHGELQVSILVAHEKQPAVSDHPLTILRQLLVQPQTRLLCHGLWNTTAQAVAYNREILALPAQETVCHIECDLHQRQKSFAFADLNGNTILAGQVRSATSTGLATIIALERVMGMRHFLQLIGAKQLVAQVVNPIGLLPFNADAHAYINADRVILQRFDPATDNITMQCAQYAGLDFAGSFVEHMQGFRFVYLNIHNAGDTQYTAEK
jgi:hypothetical protein